MVDLDELDRLHAAAFRAPWRAETWTVETDDGDEREVDTILAPDEYPSEQVVAQVGPDGQIETPGLGSLAARNAAAIAAIHNAYPELAAEVRALRERVAKAESEDEAEFAERKRIAEASDRRIVEASEKALEHLEARMRAEAERDALRERAAKQDAELVALREAVLAGEAAVRSSANAIDDYHADAFAVALAKVPR